MILLHEFDSSGIERFDNYLNQLDLLKGGAPINIYKREDIFIAELLLESTKQDQVKDFFKNYLNLNSDKDPNLYNPSGIAGISKEEALNKLIDGQQRKKEDNRRKGRSFDRKDEEEKRRTNQSREAIRKDGNQVEDRQQKTWELRAKTFLWSFFSMVRTLLFTES